MTLPKETKTPKVIKILSDNNELEFIFEKKGIYSYKYSKSKTKKGTVLELSENDLNKLIKNNQ